MMVLKVARFFDNWELRDSAPVSPALVSWRGISLYGDDQPALRTNVTLDKKLQKYVDQTLNYHRGQL